MLTFPEPDTESMTMTTESARNDQHNASTIHTTGNWPDGSTGSATGSGRSSDGPRSANAQAILELAIEMIDERGEAGIRVQELSDSVGVAITTLYRFFGSRDGLIEAAQAERYKRQLLIDVERLSVGLDLCRDGNDFRLVMERTVERLMFDDLRQQRLRRINALGSAQSRPELLNALAGAQDDVNRAMAEVLSSARERGWIRADLDLHSFAAWLSGITCARVLIELGPTSADSASWDALTVQAINNALFGSTADTSVGVRELHGVS
jgi:AcrR family transcriptional regulator